MITLSVHTDMPPDLRALDEQEVKEIRLSVGNAVRELVSAHFRARGGKWWHAAADATRRVISDNEVYIAVEHRGVRLQWLGSGGLSGGVVRAKSPRRLLAVPQQPDITEYARGYDKPLAYVKIQGKPILRGLLVEGEVAKAKNKYKDKPAGRIIVRPNGRLAYYLLEYTRHEPHPDVLPTTADMNETARTQAEKYIKLFID